MNLDSIKNWDTFPLQYIVGIVDKSPINKIKFYNTLDSIDKIYTLKIYLSDSLWIINDEQAWIEMVKFRVIEFIFRDSLHMKIYTKGQILDRSDIMRSRIVIRIGGETRTVMIEDIYDILNI